MYILDNIPMRVDVEEARQEIGNENSDFFGKYSHAKRWKSQRIDFHRK